MCEEEWGDEAVIRHAVTSEDTRSPLLWSLPVCLSAYLPACAWSYSGPMVCNSPQSTKRGYKGLCDKPQGGGKDTELSGGADGQDCRLQAAKRTDLVHPTSPSDAVMLSDTLALRSTVHARPRHKAYQVVRYRGRSSI